MNQITISEELLATCDREPIHLPGAVQPHGLLIALDAQGSPVAWAGDDALIGGDISRDAIESALDVDLRDTVSRLPATGQAMIGSPTCGDQVLDMVGHRSGDLAIVELEPSDSSGLSAAAALSVAQTLAGRLEAAHDIVEACDEAAKAVRQIIGYDRIMVYRFLPDESGEVVAEALADGMATLMNHRFPASDIPRQARALYRRNPIRIIPDVGYAPAPVTWIADEDPGEPIDMSDAHLRSVSPIHIEYLKNMGVGASASISIMVDGDLWGLVACHHESPRPVGYVHREMAKHVGQLLGMQIGIRQRSNAQMETVQLTQRRDELLHILTGIGGLDEALLRHPHELLRVVPSDGVAILSADQVNSEGSVPPERAIAPLLQMLATRGRGNVFATHRLVDVDGTAQAYANAASGALVCLVRRDPELIIGWFRAEQVKTVDWAGNPHKPVDAETGMLTPRKSFELWRDTVRCESRPWSISEVDSIERFRMQILATLDQQEMKRLNHSLRRSLGDKEDLIAQKDLLMREVHHRVQNSLQLVNSMLHIQERDANSDEIRTQFEVARQRLTAVAMVHRRLWRADKLGDVRLDTFIAELIEEQVKIWGSDWNKTIHLNVAPVVIPTDIAIIVGLIMTELMTNAVKYAYDGKVGTIAVDVAEAGRRNVRIAISDRGVGIDPGSRKKSFGTRLVETLVKQLRGRLEFRDNAPGARIELHFPLPDA